MIVKNSDTISILMIVIIKQYVYSDTSTALLDIEMNLVMLPMFGTL